MQFALVHEAERQQKIYGLSSSIDLCPYAKQYRKIGLDPTSYLILDNGAFELGTADLSNFLKWISILCPNEIVLPDRMFMADDTIRMSKVFMKRHPAILRSTGDKRIMYQGAVHGRNHKEWLDCAYALFDMGVDVLGIPKDYEAWPGGREILIEMVQKIGLPIHLLGMEKDVSAFVRWRNIESVRSMDTAKPFIRAISHQSLSSQAPVSRPPDYFDLVLDNGTIGIATNNMRIWDAWAKQR